MPAFRVYLIDNKSIIAADHIDAEDHTTAASVAVRAISSYPWYERLVPNEIASLAGARLQHFASM
jgi:hypothetical protein